ncbi:hypothetical protein Hanom_Chr04g00314231 [Helianthus anomalus]
MYTTLFSTQIADESFTSILFRKKISRCSGFQIACEASHHSFTAVCWFKKPERPLVRIGLRF